MKIIVDDIWNYERTGHIVIPTNLMGVMGRGLALQAKRRHFGLEVDYKRYLRVEKDFAKHLLVPWQSCNSWPGLLLLAVKPRYWQKASLLLIESGLRELVKEEYKYPVYVPALGCGFGELTWEEVSPLLQKYLKDEDKFILVLADDDVRKRYAYAFEDGTRKDNGVDRRDTD